MKRQSKPAPKNFEMPEGLSPEGKQAWKVFTQFFVKKDMVYTGGCKTFYSPQEWIDRGEEYGTKSLLLVVHDGGDVAQVCNMDYMNYRLHDELIAHLGKHGFYFEPCTCWYGAIYKD